MPLILQKSIDTCCHFMVWEMTEPIDYFKKLLKKINYNLPDFEKISHPLKQREWLASRFVAKKLAESLDINYLGLIKDHYDKPFLQDSSVHLSISHSRHHVAAAIHLYQPIGIDLEIITEKLYLIKEKFLKSNEIFDANNDLENLCIYWSAKESLYKLYGKKGVNFKEQLNVYRFNKNDETINSEILMPDFEGIFQIKHFKFDKTIFTIAF